MKRVGDKHIYIHNDKVFKYISDPDSVEGEIMMYLKQSDPELSIPDLIEIRRDVVCPAGIKFPILLIMRYIQGIGFKYDLNCAKELCAIVHRIHTLDIWHRDINVNNLIRSVDGRLYLIDFGEAVSENNPKFKKRVFNSNLEQDNLGILENQGIGVSKPEHWEVTPTNCLFDD